MMVLLALTTRIIESMKMLYRNPRYPMFFFPKYSVAYPVEYIETENAVIDIIRIKNADNLST